MQVLLTVFDRVSSLHESIFAAPNEAAGIRSVADALAKPGRLADHAADFELVRLGAYDEVAGVVVGLPRPEVVCRLSSLVVPK